MGFEINILALYRPKTIVLADEAAPTLDVVGSEAKRLVLNPKPLPFIIMVGFTV